MARYTYAEMMGLSKSGIQAAIANPATNPLDLPKLNNHLTYRNDLETYSGDVASKASAGPGSFPPGNPPPPPAAF